MNKQKDIKNMVDNLFFDLTKKHKLKRGDITPEQNTQIKDFEDLLIEFVNQNKEVKEWKQIKNLLKKIASVCLI